MVRGPRPDPMTQGDDVRSTRLLLVLMLLLALVAAACGSDDSDSDDAGADVSTDDGSDGDGAGDADQADVQSDGGDSDDGGSDEPMSGDGGSDWCTSVRNAAENPDDSPLSFDFMGLSADQLEDQFKQNLNVLEQWASRAPSEIDGDVDTIVGAYRTFIDLGDAADWDFMSMANDPAFEEAFDDDALDTASTRVDQYTRDVCGVDLGVVGAAADTPTAPEIPADADLVTQIFGIMGIPAGMIPDDIASCMNDSLEASGVFEDGFTTADLANEEVLDAIDDAADACGFNDL